MSSFSDPAGAAVAVTPSNTVMIAYPQGNTGRGLWVGGAGDISVLMSNDLSVTFVGVLAGQLLPIRAKRVNLTGTTATNILALY